MVVQSRCCRLQTPRSSAWPLEATVWEAARWPKGCLRLALRRKFQSQLVHERVQLLAVSLTWLGKVASPFCLLASYRKASFFLAAQFWAQPHWPWPTLHTIVELDFSLYC